MAAQLVVARLVDAIQAVIHRAVARRVDVPAVPAQAVDCSAEQVDCFHV